MSNKSLFEQWLFEAPGDDPPPDEPEAATTAPDVPEDPPADDPPDLDANDIGGADDAPPDDIDDGPPDLNEDDFGGDDFGGDIGGSGQDVNNMGLDSKVSAILNLNLYQSYVELVSQVSSQLASIKHNADLLYAITPDTEQIVTALRKLEENLRLYIDNNFVDERYEKNLLFYNKCKNLNKFLNDKFDSLIHKGIKETT